MYLEPIFNSEDIKTSLKSENIQFENIHKIWLDIMMYVENDPKATSIHEIPMLETNLVRSLETMHKIKKSLDDYLNKKRAKFPRFYFLSNEEMLAILSETKDPYLV
jgi:dynein heavy chain